MSAQQDTNAYFNVPDAYDNFMGRFSRPLGLQFVKSIPLAGGDRVLDLGCGPGALTESLVDLLGAESVAVVDPSPPFLETCVRRHPGVTGKVGSAEEIPFEDNSFDAVMSQLVIHFVLDLDRAGKEMIRVTKPGGWIAACTWIFNQMDLLYIFDQAAMNVTGSAPPNPPANEFREEGAIGRYFTSIGLTDVAETTLRVSTTYPAFNDLWDAYLAGIGPLGAWLKGQPDESKDGIRSEVFRMLGEPADSVTLNAVARSAHGRSPV